jgi:hypothetical protein
MTLKLRWGRVIAWFLACAYCRTALAEPASLDWEAAFPVESAVRDVYLDAHFVGSDGAAHRLQLWRHGSEFLHRRTDAALDLYLHQAERKGDYAYRLIDHRRRVAMDVSRNQLYRIGVFSDWFGLAHVLDRPKSEFVVRAVAPLQKERRTDELSRNWIVRLEPSQRLGSRWGQKPCSWRLLVRGGKQSQDQTRICWSAKWGLPVSIRGRGAKGDWIEQFGVDRVEEISPSVDGLALPPLPDGYASFDAGNEIDPKQGD